MLSLKIAGSPGRWKVLFPERKLLKTSDFRAWTPCLMAPGETKTCCSLVLEFLNSMSMRKINLAGNDTKGGEGANIFKAGNTRKLIVLDH